MTSAVYKFLIISAVGTSSGILESATIKKPWTFLVYMAADNNLEPYSLLDQKEMEKIGSNEFINVLIYCCTRRKSEPKQARRLVVHKGSTQQVGVDMGADSGSAATLIQACNWALTEFPADHFALILWNHGAGWRKKVDDYRGICFDDSTHHYLTDSALAQALQKISRTRLNNKKIDIVGCDACLMASIEIAYAIAPYASYLVSSEETIPGEGWQYKLALDPFATKALSAPEFAQWMVTSYGSYYKNKMNYYTLSALDLSVVPALAASIHQLAQLFLPLLKNNSLKHTLNKSSNNTYCTYFSDPSYIDLHHLYTNLLKNVSSTQVNAATKTALRKNISTGLTLIKQCVIARVQGSFYPKAAGISIYFPQDSMDPLYTRLLWSKQGRWPSLLTQYFKK